MLATGGGGGLFVKMTHGSERVNNLLTVIVEILVS